MFLIFRDHTRVQGKEHTHEKKNFLSVSDFPRSHRVAGKRAYAEMKGIDPVIKKLNKQRETNCKLQINIVYLQILKMTQLGLPETFLRETKGVPQWNKCSQHNRVVLSARK